LGIPAKLTGRLDSDIAAVKDIFAGDEGLVVRRVTNQADPSIRCCIFYIDGMVNNRIVDDDLIKPVQQYRPVRGAGDLLSTLSDSITSADSTVITYERGKIAEAVLYGDTVLLADGCTQALLLNSKGWNTRSIAEPENEKALRGPREGFNESLLVDLSLLRRRLRTPDLRFSFLTLGGITGTRACVCYLDSLVDRVALSELQKRLSGFTGDSVLDSNYITECIRDAPYSPFKTVGSTERPDVVAGRLLEGRIALFVDGTPVVLTVPYLFIENFQSDDDYYLSYFFASIGRILRILSFIITTGIPAVYIALITFHQEMLPTPLLMSIDMAQQSVPFPSVVEAALMLIVFEMLREAGLRMPGYIGQALSIVGALVIGQAAVDARIISAPMVIVVGLTGITGLMIPRTKGAVIMLRFFLLAASAVLGLYGYIFGMLALMIHLYGLVSFGMPVMGSSSDATLQGVKDTFIRAPWWLMKKRPRGMSQQPSRGFGRDAG
jgi:spore germination protein KA